MYTDVHTALMFHFRKGADPKDLTKKLVIVNIHTFITTNCLLLTCTVSEFPNCCCYPVRTI